VDLLHRWVEADEAGTTRLTVGEAEPAAAAYTLPPGAHVAISDLLYAPALLRAGAAAPCAIHARVGHVACAQCAPDGAGVVGARGYAPRRL
jgi:hypothetical protein